MKTKILLLFSLAFFFLETQAQIKIVPLGNSITQGNNFQNSYRRNLFHSLQAANILVDFVGSIDSNFNGYPPIPDFDMNHEGHWGWRTDEILSGRTGEGKLSSWLQGYTPDAALIHLGSNDMFQWQSQASTITEIEQVIDTLRADNPNIVVFLALLIPTDYPAWNPRITALNALIPNIAATKSQVNSPIIIVDQNSGFNPTIGADTYDRVHPNANGEAKMAQKWFDAIKQYYNPLPIELESFSVNWNPNKNQIDLKWATLSETNTHYFEIEKSETNGQTWETLTTINAVGNSSNYQSYEFQDLDFQNQKMICYRLKIIDQDGQFEFSNIECAMPVSDMQTQVFYDGNIPILKINSSKNQVINLRLLNHLGQNVLVENLSLQAGENIFNLSNNSNLTSGIYWVNISHNGFQNTQKILLK